MTIADKARQALDEYEADVEELKDLLFFAIYERTPDIADDVVDLIYAAADVLSESEAARVLEVFGEDWA